MPLSGASPIQSGAIVRLGSFFFDPPPTVVEADKTAYVVEHETPGSEGGVVEYLGSRQSAFTLRGDLISGGDFDINQLLGMKGTSQNFSVSSTIPGQVFASGPVVVEDVKFVYQGGVGYPWYGFAIKLRNTGAAAGGITGLILQTNIQIGIGLGGQLVGVGYRNLGSTPPTFNVGQIINGNSSMARFPPTYTVGKTIGGDWKWTARFPPHRMVGIRLLS